MQEGDESSRAGGPFLVEACAIIERLLRSNSRRGQARVEIRATDGFLFGHAFAKKHSEASDERVSGTSTVYAFHLECRDVLAALAAGEKRSIRTQRDDHSSNAA